MTVRRYISVGLAILWLVAIIYAASRGWMTLDLSGIPTFAWLYGAGTLVVGAVWHHFMKSAALREAHDGMVLGHRVPGEDFVTRWTRWGAACGTAYLTLGLLFVVVTAEYPPEDPQQIGAVVIALAFAGAVGGLAGAYRAQRYTRIFVAELAESQPKVSDNPPDRDAAV